RAGRPRRWAQASWLRRRRPCPRRDRVADVGEAVVRSRSAGEGPGVRRIDGAPDLESDWPWGSPAAPLATRRVAVPVAARVTAVALHLGSVAALGANVRPARRLLRRGSRVAD